MSFGQKARCRALLATGLGAAIAMGGPAGAEPRNAGWDGATPDAPNACVSCHFDNEPVLRSEAITLDGLPEAIAPGEVYMLTLRFTPPEAQVVGFLAVASAGVFEAAGPDAEAHAGSARSYEPAPVQGEWRMRWRAPEDGTGGRLTFSIAANAGNDDASPFGDVIHYARFDRPPAD